MMMMMISRLG